MVLRHQAQEPNLQTFSWEARNNSLILMTDHWSGSFKMPGQSYYDYWRLTVMRWNGEIEVFIKLFIILDNDPSICSILSSFGYLAVPNLGHKKKKILRRIWPAHRSIFTHLFIEWQLITEEGISFKMPNVIFIQKIWMRLRLLVLSTVHFF